MPDQLLAQASLNSPWLTLALGFGAATLIAWGLSVLVARMGRRYGLLDPPGGRHAHSIAAPRLGGVAIFLAFALVAGLLYHPASSYEAHVARGLFAASALTVLVMTIDDLRGLNPWLRLLAQTAAALLVIFPGAHGMIIEVIHNPLSSGAAAIMAAVSWMLGQQSVALLCIILAGATLGFLL